VTWQTLLGDFAAGVLISTITAPVGVSGAVFLLPVQLSFPHVASPAVTPRTCCSTSWPARGRSPGTTAPVSSPAR
jgi:uncharacterized membrane protein YfcA